MRNILGRETDMTLFCGEQVMPCQEQGVELDGFQVERIEEDCLTKGSEEERRERRTWPSWDKDVTTWVLIIVR